MNAPTKPKPAQTVENVLDELKPTGLALLRQPFPPHQISKLPKPIKKDAPKGKCAECGGYHGLPAIHLDYVGHAALTDRLLDCDPNWSWEPMGTTPEGLPAINGGLWIKLTVCGVSRYGFGAADGKSGGDAIKEMIGDALRNAAMRFGAALDLWHKGDLHADDDSAATPTGTESGAISEAQWNELLALAEKAGVTPKRICSFFQIDDLTKLPAAKYSQAEDMLNNTIAKQKEPADA